MNASRHALDPRAASRGPYLFEMSVGLTFGGPFHIGTGERLSVRTDAPVLRNRNGRLWLPGSSIRGVVRDWCEREAPLLGVERSALVRLFGAIPDDRRPKAARGDRQGRLQVHDIDLGAEQLHEVRDHVRLDPRFGAGDNGGKFDRELGYTPVGTLRLVYEGESPDDPEARLLRALEDALRNGLLTFGAHSGSGLGRVRATSVVIRELARSDPHGLSRYLKGRLEPGNGVASSTAGRTADIGPRPRDPDERVALSWMRLRVRVQFEGPMLVAASYRGGDTASPEFKADATYQVGFLGRPVLPGSSLRGAIRHHAMRVAATAGADDLVPILFGSIARRRRVDDRSSEPDKDEPMGQRGLISIGEGELAGAPHKVVLNHVAIDRITGFAADQRLFSTTALASPAFTTDLLLRWNDDEADESAAVALLLFVLRDIEAGFGWIGSRTSRGYGHVHSISIEEAAISRVRRIETRVWQRDPAVRVRDARVSDLQDIAESLVATWRARIGAVV